MYLINTGGKDMFENKWKDSVKVASRKKRDTANLLCNFIYRYLCAA